MAIAPSFAALFKGSGNPSAYRLLSGTTPTQVQSDFPGSPALETPTAQQHFKTNYVCQFGDELFSWHRNVVYKKDDTTGNWSAVHSISNMDTSQGYSYHSGLFIADDSGPKMFGVYGKNSGSTLSYLTTTDGSSFVEADSTGTHTNYFTRPVIYRNVFYWADGSTVRALELDGTLTTYTSVFPTGRSAHAGFGVFDNRLFVIGLDSDAAGTPWKIWEFLGGTFTVVHTIAASNGVALNSSRFQAACLFTDSTFLYALFPSQNASVQHSNYLVKLTKSGAGFTESDISTLTLPSELRNGGANTGAYTRFDSLIDDETEATSPGINLFYLDDNAGDRTYYPWSGASTPMVGSSSASGNYALSAIPGGGERFWSSGDLNIEIISFTTLPSGTEISFKAYGDAGGGDDKTCRFYFNSSEENPVTQCTLVGTATGGSATRNGNQVEDVKADDGVTTYTAIWDAATDGLSAGTRVTAKATISTTTGP